MAYILLYGTQVFKVFYFQYYYTLKYHYTLHYILDFIAYYSNSIHYTVYTIHTRLHIKCFSLFCHILFISLSQFILHPILHA